jgi:hypothetical protein
MHGHKINLVSRQSRGMCLFSLQERLGNVRRENIIYNLKINQNRVSIQVENFELQKQLIQKIYSQVSSKHLSNSFS